MSFLNTVLCVECYRVERTADFGASHLVWFANAYKHIDMEGTVWKEITFSNLCDSVVLQNHPEVAESCNSPLALYAAGG